MKTCYLCHFLKEETDFCKKKNGRVNSYCKLCQRSYSKEHYKNNKQDYLTRNKNSKSIDKFKKRIREYKSTTPCKDCGQTYPYYVMDFDHLHDKKCDVSQLVNSGRSAKARTEILKCELVCANCHRGRTHKRLCSKNLPVAQS